MQSLSYSKPTIVIVCGVSLALACVAALIVYRLYLHPLSAFPGPTIAAVTGWYETYYDVFMRGKVLDKLEVLHRRYGTWSILHGFSSPA